MYTTCICFPCILMTDGHYIDLRGAGVHPSGSDSIQIRATYKGDIDIQMNFLTLEKYSMGYSESQARSGDINLRIETYRSGLIQADQRRLCPTRSRVLWCFTWGHLKWCIYTLHTLYDIYIILLMLYHHHAKFDRDWGLCIFFLYTANLPSLRVSMYSIYRYGSPDSLPPARPPARLAEWAGSR